MVNVFLQQSWCFVQRAEAQGKDQTLTAPRCSASPTFLMSSWNLSKVFIETLLFHHGCRSNPLDAPRIQNKSLHLSLEEGDEGQRHWTTQWFTLFQRTQFWKLMAICLDKCV